MQENTEKSQQTTQPQPQPTAKPNDRAGFAVMGHVKIFDPNTKTVYVETRG
jgi:hypothetical protein